MASNTNVQTTSLLSDVSEPPFDFLFDVDNTDIPHQPDTDLPTSQSSTAALPTSKSVLGKRGPKQRLHDLWAHARAPIGNGPTFDRTGKTPQRIWYCTYLQCRDYIQGSHCCDLASHMPTASMMTVGWEHTVDHTDSTDRGDNAGNANWPAEYTH